jgi:ABC-2 type transport system ATP-binding protein
VDGISVRRIEKRFGEVKALDRVSFEVEPGEVVALLGPNGAGKSTLLRILGTTIIPDAGSATIAGHDVVAEPMAARRALGLMLGDERSHYWRLSGRRNLLFFAALAGLRRREALSRVAQLLDAVGLAEAADRRVLGYSSGMRARLSLARSLLSEPPVLLLDEPTRNLDPLAGSGFRETTAQLAAEHGTGILFATHDLHEAAAIATRVLVLSGGRVVLEEPVLGMDAVRLESAFLEAVRSHGGEELAAEAMRMNA